MKKGGTKRIAALLLALAMVFGLNTAAFAAGDEPVVSEKMKVTLKLVDCDGSPLSQQTLKEMSSYYQFWTSAWRYDEDGVDIDNRLWRFKMNAAEESVDITCNVPADGRMVTYEVDPWSGKGLEADFEMPDSIPYQARIGKGQPASLVIVLRLKSDSQFSSKSGGSWVQSGNRWWYQNSDGSYPHADWARIGGAWYHFDASGWMQTGWINLGGTWYYLNGDGSMATGWVNDGGAWYYLDRDGAMVTGWWEEIIFLDNDVVGEWYYLTGSGAMATGWINDGGTWYYLAGSGAMATGWVNDGGTWYYLAGSGAMATGWVNDGGTWYYMTGSGAMATGWIDLGGTWYYLNSDGAMATNTWIGSYYVNADGAWVA